MDNFFVDASVFATYALTSGTQEYDIGPAAAAPFAVNSPPSRIQGANLVYTAVSPNRERPLRILDDDERMAIIDPNASAGTPWALHYRIQLNGALGKLWFHPKPTSGYSVKLETWVDLPVPTDLDVPFTFPKSYYETVVYNLAKRLCTPEWGRDLTASIEDLATSARARTEALNMTPPPKQTCDWGSNDGFDIERGYN